ncbi:MAG: response regulator [Gammaproteobacteria bacterium]
MTELSRILYIEDEPDIQAIAQIALEDVGGFDVRICSSGQEAMQGAPEFNPQLILLDVMMPGMDGPSALANLRTLPELKDIPAIFMTAKVQPQEIEELLNCGAIDVIAKPFEPMTLADNIRKIWNSAQ